jgi:membrane-bound metal-dependent hydrolase YbcI (DUF457 family)
VTPFGHLSVSYITGNAFKKVSLPAIIIGGVIPDIDFMFLPFFFFNQIHRVITHNLLFIVITAAAIGCWFKGKKKFYIIFGIILGGMIHLMIDACMDTNPTNGIGVPFFWPFDQTCYSPFNLLSSVYCPGGWNDILCMAKSTCYSLAYEIPLYALTIFIFIKKRDSLR